MEMENKYIEVKIEFPIKEPISIDGKGNFVGLKHKIYLNDELKERLGYLFVPIMVETILEYIDRNMYKK